MFTNYLLKPSRNLRDVFSHRTLINIRLSFSLGAAISIRASFNSRFCAHSRATLSLEICIVWSSWVICCANTIQDRRLWMARKNTQWLWGRRTTLSENITALSRPIPNLIRESRQSDKTRTVFVASPDLRQADGSHLGQLPPRGPPKTPVYPFARIQLISFFPRTYLSLLSSTVSFAPENLVPSKPEVFSSITTVIFRTLLRFYEKLIISCCYLKRCLVKFEMHEGVLIALKCHIEINFN